LSLDGWVDAIARRHGFVANEHRVEISGLCDACR
jgi:Fe2+ or Zn2+ uptake regulation protein